MGKYLLGSVLVFVIAAYLVNFGIKRTQMDAKIDEAMDVPYGEYDALGIKNADADGWMLFLDNMRLYSSRKGTGTFCQAERVKIFFPEEKNAKLVMKLRYNLGPFLAKPLRDISAQDALKPESQELMIKSLKDGYAAQYGLKTMTKVLIENLTCKEMQ